MTLQEAKLYRQFGFFTPSSCAPVPVIPSQVLPQSCNSLDTPEAPRPLTPDSYNHVPLDDVKLFRQFKYSDSLHRTDGIANDYARGQKLNVFIKQHGRNKFLEQYDSN